MKYYDYYQLSSIRDMLDRVLKQRNYVDLDGDRFVRIPQMEGRINELEGPGGTLSLEFVYERWYDPKAKQSRNRKLIIGRIPEAFPHVLIPNENYGKLFDYETGELKEPYKTNIAKEQAKKEKSKAQKAQKPTPKTTEILNPGPEPEPPTQTNEAPQQTMDDKELDQGIRDMLANLQKTKTEWERQEREQQEQKAQSERDRKLYGEANYQDMERRRAEQRLQAVADRITQQEQKPTSAEEEALLDAYMEYNYDRERAAVLSRIIEGILNTIRTQAKKRPDDIVNAYKVNKINTILQEIKTRYQNTGYEDLLELIDPPTQNKETNTQTGLTYSDLEVLLDHYTTILEHIPSNRKQSDSPT